MASKKKTPKSTPRGANALGVSVYSGWTVAQVRSALQGHENGDFSASAMLVDAMFRDDRIFATVDTRVLGVLGLPLVVDPSEETSNVQAAERLATRVSGWWFSAFPEAQWADVLRWQLMMGFCVAEAIYENIDGEERPTLTVHHPANISWNDTEQCFYLATQEGRIKVTPGDGRWVLFAPHGALRPWMRGAVRALAIPYLMRSFAKRDWARRSEIEGVGIKRARVPREADDDILDQFLQQVRRLKSEDTIRLPEGYDVDLLTTNQSEGGSDGFSKLIGSCDSAITLSILGQNLTTEIEGGSYAAASVHARVQLDRIKSDVAMLSTTSRFQIIEPWGYLNIPNFDPKTAPWPRWDTTPPEDLNKYGGALQTIAQAMTGLVANRVDLTPILERFGLKQMPPEEAPVVPNAPSPIPDPNNPADVNPNG